MHTLSIRSVGVSDNPRHLFIVEFHVRFGRRRNDLQHVFDASKSYFKGFDLSLFNLNHIKKAQAQECVLEKAVVDSRKASICAKISAQVVDYCRLALTNCEKQDFQNNVGSKKSKVIFLIEFHKS